MTKPTDQPRPMHQPAVFALLRDAQGEIVSLRTIGRKLYGQAPTEAQRASMRSMIQRIRVQERGAHEIKNVPGKGYRLVPAEQRSGKPVEFNGPGARMPLADRPNIQAQNQAALRSLRAVASERGLS